MSERQCTDCGELIPSGSTLCTSCGAHSFRDVPPRLAARLDDGTAHVPSLAVRISTERVILVTVLSAGPYVFYWFYLTWKQLESETGREHYPAWHSLTLFVPIYNLFRMHAHVRVIGELAAREGVTSVMAPGLAVVLLVVSNSLGYSSLRIDNYGVLSVLNLISIALSTTLVVTAQRGLNLYWKRVRPPDTLPDARTGLGEVGFVVLGILLWIGIFIPL